MPNHYFILGKFILDGCSYVLRELFLQEAKDDAGPAYTTLEDFLTKHRTDIEGKCLRFPPQRELVYPSDGSKVKISKWDVTLLCSLLTKLFQNLPVKDHIKVIREERNHCQHIPSTQIKLEKFAQKWSSLQNAANSIADYLVDKSIKQHIETLINELWNKNATEKMISELEAKLKDGTLDPHVSYMKAMLQKDLENKLKPTDEPAAELNEVVEKLQSHRRVLICCNDRDYKSSYQTALCAIKQQTNYDLERCVLMDDPSRWPLCYMQADLVLFPDPFGYRGMFRKTRAEQTVQVFDRMLEATEGGETAVIIVTRNNPLEKFNKKFLSPMTTGDTVVNVGGQGKSSDDQMGGPGKPSNNKSGDDIGRQVLNADTVRYVVLPFLVVCGILGVLVIGYTVLHHVIDGLHSFDYSATVRALFGGAVSTIFYSIKAVIYGALKFGYKFLQFIFGPATFLIVMLIIAVPIAINRSGYFQETSGGGPKRSSVSDSTRRKSKSSKSRKSKR